MPASQADINVKYKRKLDSLLGGKPLATDTSATYQEFEKTEERRFRPNSFYEKYCSMAGRYLSFLKPGKNKERDFWDSIIVSGMHVTPQQAWAATFMTFFLAIFLGIPFFIMGIRDFCFFLWFTGAFFAYIVYSYPEYQAQITRIKVQQESLLAMLYMTIYLKVNPVLENAIYFASQHLNGPFGRDLKQLMWLMESGKASTVAEATEFFMPLWTKRNPDFVKSFLILRSILNQSDEENQSRILNKALDTLLNETYEKMKHYSHDLQGPVMILQTFGMMLPLIGLIAFPMISVFMADQINITYLFFTYIVILPSLLFFFTSRLISKRPGAFSHPDITHNPFIPPLGYYKFKIGKLNKLVPLMPIAIILALLIMLPGVLHFINNTIPAYMEGRALSKTDTIPEFGPLANEYTWQSMLIMITIPIGLAVGIIFYCYFNSVQRVKIREQILEIEDDLPESLFQLGNQFTERIPVEDAVKNFVLEYDRLNLRKRSIYLFFSEILQKMQNVGMTFGDAIFHSREGVLVRYPSVLLKEIAWILVEGARKGAQILYNVTTKISVYLGSVKKIKELLYDLLAETVTSINVQAKFLAPFLAAVVGSLTFVIVRALWLMTLQLDAIIKTLSLGVVNAGDILGGLFNLTRVTPPTMFQAMVGVYLIEAVYLLSNLANGVENGFDNVSRQATVARNMLYAIIVYVLISLVGVLVMNQLVNSIQNPI